MYLNLRLSCKTEQLCIHHLFLFVNCHIFLLQISQVEPAVIGFCLQLYTQITMYQEEEFVGRVGVS